MLCLFSLLFFLFGCLFILFGCLFIFRGFGCCGLFGQLAVIRVAVADYLAVKKAHYSCRIAVGKVGIVGDHYYKTVVCDLF